MKLYEPSVIKDISNRYDFRLSRSLGQNFITDGSVIDGIVVGAGITEEDLVIEIGPGIGVLTARAAASAGRVVAVEIDGKLIPVLKETLAGYDNIRIVNSDILKTDIKGIIEEEAARGFKGPVKIIGNLPYYITTPIIMKLLEEDVPAESITVMMQKEVADRIRSGPGSRAYGAISVAVQYYCSVEEIMKVSREVFIPRPKVDSAVLKLTVREKPSAEPADKKAFFSCVRAAFGQRRKTLLNSLMGYLDLSKGEIGAVLDEAGIDSRRRAETLSIEEFSRISDRAVELAKNK